jgi:hypothetical protein
MYRKVYVSDEFLSAIQALIDLAAPGEYRFSDLLGPAWNPLELKPEWGRWFKHAVKARLFSGIEIRGKTARNHQVYHIFRRS